MWYNYYHAVSGLECKLNRVQKSQTSSNYSGEIVQIKDKTRVDDGEVQELSFTMVATVQEVEESAKEFFHQISQKDIPGFRKGKAPRNILEQSIGGHANAMGGVAETLINEFAFKAIDDEGILFIGDPQFNVAEMLEEGKPFSFDVSGPVAPSMHLTSYEPVSIVMPPEEATEQDIQAQIRELQSFYHSFETIGDAEHKAEWGDYVEMTLTVTNHGRMVSGLGAADRMIGLGEGTMPESFDAQVVGSKVGDRLEFDFEAKDAEGESEYGDGELSAIVEVKGLRRCIVPEVDDAFAGKVGCENVDDLRKQLKLAINMQKRKDLPGLMVDRAIDQLVDRLDGAVPAYYVDFIRQDVGREMIQSLKQQGTSLQQWMLQNSIDGDKMKEKISTEAERRAAIDCALESLFAQKGWELSEEDIDGMFSSERGLEGAREDWEKSGRMASVRKMCRQSKSTEWLVETAVVTVVEEPVE